MRVARLTSRTVSRILAVGLVCAVGGFCFGIAGPTSTSGSDVDFRGVGTTRPLQITNPFLTDLAGSAISTEFDLGDAAFGSQIVRYLTSTGGLRPYAWTSTGPNSLVEIVEGTTSSLQLGLSGILAGSTPQALPGGGSDMRFRAVVTDARGVNNQSRTGFFHLFLFDSRGIFRFAHNRLSDGQLGSPYLSRIEAIGGTLPLTFTLLAVNNSGTGAPVDARSLGLFVGKDGTISGVPLISGAFNLRIRCVDGKNVTARNRANSITDETVAINIVNNTITSTDLTTIACTVRGKRNESGKDSLMYSGIINALGKDSLALLNSDVAFSLAGLTVSGRLDRNGKLSTTLIDGSKATVSLSPKTGKVTIKVSKGTFLSALDVANLGNGLLTRRGVQVSLGDGTSSSELLDFETTLTGSGYTLSYGLGRRGATLGGLFQIIAAEGKDGTSFTGQPGDSWKVSFIAAPKTGVVDPNGLSQGFSGVTSATIRIGDNFLQQARGARLDVSGDRLGFKGAREEGVKSFSLNTARFQGQLTTNVLSSAITGIPQAISSPGFDGIFFELGVDFVRSTGAPYSGEHARRIYGLKNSWKDARGKNTPRLR